MTQRRATRNRTCSGSPAWDDGVPDAINIALSQLVERLGDIPYVLIVSGEASRTIWPGLANMHLGRPAGPDGRINGKLPLPGAPQPRPLRSSA